MSPQPMIVLEGVTKVFPGMSRPAVDHLDLVVGEGELVTLVGPSGCGKTSILKMINRIIEPTSGRIVIDGQDALAVEAHQLRRRIGYVIQQIGLFPHRTIAENIATVPALLEWEQSRIDQRTGELVDLVGLDRSMLDRYPSELSGGQQQRVGVARALAADPPIMLMDEPFGAVDPIVRSRLQDELLDLHRRLGKTIVFVTHDIDEALFLGTKVAILNFGGILEQYDSPAEILAEPSSHFVADFLGGERGLKRLALLPVTAVELTTGPVVDVDATPEEAREVMRRNGVDWVGLLDDGMVKGWVWSSDLDGRPLDQLEAKDFLVSLSPRSSLREALDAVVVNRARVGVITDEGRYLGMIDLEAIAGTIEE